MFDLNEERVKEKTMEYELLYAEGNYVDSYTSYMELQEKVNEKISQGWELQGGVTVGYLGKEQFCICQAMIKRNTKHLEEKNLDGSKIEIRKID